MKWLGFMIFTIATLLYVWNDKGYFNKEQWVRFLLKFLLVYVVLFIVIMILKGIQYFWPELPVFEIKTVLIPVSSSLLCMLGVKFLVVMLYTTSVSIMGFHKKHNVDNFEMISSLSNALSPSLYMLAKCLVSCGSVLIFYGVWIA